MNYESVIGLEVHAELSTKSKIFCSCDARFGAEINTHCCPVCTGMPGALPVLNREVVTYAAKMGISTGCTINRICKSDRKNYFYPDLPKSYQISQFDVPICSDGVVEFYVEGEKKTVRLERIHFEEDAGKLLHDECEGTVIDFNRCGVPLIEMVTYPDIRSSLEAHEFLETIKTILSYLGICDCKMEEGSIRCDINVSLRHFGQEEYGTRVEMKNVNTFSGAARAIDYEIKRQTEILNKGGQIEQETRRWDDSKQKSTVMRTKEDAHDYRYFPDPDLVEVEIDDVWMNEIASSVPCLHVERYEKYIDAYGLSEKDASAISASFDKAEFFDVAVDLKKAGPKAIANWMLSDVSKYLNDKQAEIKDTKLTPKKLVDLIELIDSSIISGAAGKKVLVNLFETDERCIDIVERLGLKQVSDENATRDLIIKAINDNPKSLQDYKSGKKNAQGYLIGQCMKASKGQANPQVLSKLMSEILEIM